MKRINAARIIDFFGLMILFVNIALTAVIVFVANNPIISVYKIIFGGLVGINTIILLLISIFRKKKIVLINIFVIALMFLAIRFSKTSLSEDEIWDYRTKVVHEIEEGSYEVNDGVIELPNETIYEKVSDTKRVILAMDGDRAVMYFYKSAGMLEDSCGYIYYSDKIDDNLCTDTYEFINKEHLDGNWYSCSTQ